MKKKILAFILIILTVLLSFCFLSCGKTDNSKSLSDIIKSDKLRVGIIPSLPGLCEYNENSQKYEGYEIDIAFIITQKIFGCTYDEAKKKLVFVIVEPENRVNYLENDKVDLIIAGFTANELNGKRVALSTPYLTPSLGLVSLTEEKIKSLNAMNGKNIGTVEGMNTDSLVKTFIRESGLDITVNCVKIDQEMFNAYIVSLRTDITPSENLTEFGCDCLVTDNLRFTDYVKNKEDYFDMTAVGQSYAIAAAKGSDMLIQRINIALGEMEANDEFEGLQIMWNLKSGAIKYD
ncbi:MAG: transporter substrate-binding domain-containing protein [Eubacteriales bacterium]|nr:transporter substrate-binding domain-containing protein [Eubacteriales bacterium]